ncbi:MAG: hypothetical protein EB127_20335, partial [Alphaproteobacteria bacterium]|nr:hypothetical protein [Alphaproteobacteria bacterium]
FPLYFLINAYTISLLIEAYIEKTQPDEAKNKLDRIKEFQTGLVKTRSEYLEQIPPWAQVLFGSNPKYHPLDPIVKMIGLETHLGKYLDNTVRQSLLESLRVSGEKTGIYVQSMTYSLQAVLGIVDELILLIPEQIIKLIQHVPSERPIHEKCRFLFFIRRMQQPILSLEEHKDIVEHLADILLFMMIANKELAQHREWKEWPRLLKKFITTGYQIPWLSNQEIGLCQAHQKILAPLLVFFLSQHQKLADLYLNVASESLLKYPDWILQIYETDHVLACRIGVFLVQNNSEAAYFIDQIRNEQPLLALHLITHLKKEIQLKIFMNHPEKWSKCILEQGADLTCFTHLFLHLEKIPAQNVYICRCIIRSLTQMLEKKTAGAVEVLTKQHLPFLQKRRKLEGLRELPRYPFLIQQLYKQNIQAQRLLIEQEYIDLLSGKSHVEEFLLTQGSNEDVVQIRKLASSYLLPAEFLDPLALRIKEKTPEGFIDFLRWAENSEMDREKLVPYIMMAKPIIETKPLEKQLEYLHHITEKGYPNQVLQEHYTTLQSNKLILSQERAAVIKYTELILDKADLIGSFIEQITQPSFAGQDIDNYIMLFDIALKIAMTHPTDSYTRWLIKILHACPPILSTGKVLDRLKLSDLPIDLQYFQLLKYLITHTSIEHQRAIRQGIAKALLAELERLATLSLGNEEIIEDYITTKQMFMNTYAPENLDSSWYIQELLHQINHGLLPS